MIGTREELVEQALSHLEALSAMKRRALSDEPAARQISMQQLHILMTLQERGEMPVTTLATMLAVSPPSASSIVDRMEQHGLVERRRDEADRRVVHIALTDRGTKAVDEMVGVHRERACRLLQSMSEEELEHVVEGLAAVCRAIARLEEPG